VRGGKMNITLSREVKIGQKKKRKIGLFVRYLLIFILVVPMLLPLLWMLSTALKGDGAVFSIPPQWIPKDLQFSNFTEGLRQIDFWHRFLNTTIISILCVIGQCVSCLMVGYSISRIKFPGRKVWFYLIIGSMMLPGMVSMIPVFRVYSKLGMYNTWIPLILPAFLGSPFFIFMTRQFMSTIPISFDEAAKIDGATHLQILGKIIVPMCKPLIASIAIMTFQGTWSDYLTPLIYIIDPKKWTLSLAMGQFMGGTYGTKWNLFMAADLVYMLPILIIFFFAQDYFMQGLGSMNSSGIK
jgi:multiple sugar transport system permease protein